MFFLAPFFQQLLSWLESFQLLACITFWKMDLTRPSYLKFNQQNKLTNKPETYQYYDGQGGKDSVQCTHFLSFFGQHYKLSSVERGISSLVQFHGIDTENPKNVPLKSKILTSWLYIFLFNIFPCFLLNFLCKRFEFKFSSSSTQISFSSQLEVKVSMPV